MRLSQAVSAGAHELASVLFAPIVRDLEAVESRLQALALVDCSPLQGLLERALGTPGKLLRPSLTIACGKVFRESTSSLHAMAVAVECLHTATLIHDDIVDETSERRGAPALHTSSGRAAALLAGDYLFAQAAAVACETNNLRIMRLFSECVMKLCTGQIEEHSQGRDARLWLSREGYYRTIDAKTAALFTLACESGAVLGEASIRESDALRRYGRALGLAFQIIDDILDLVGDESVMGKPAGSDLRQGVVTLPLIYMRDEIPERTLLAVFGHGGQRDEAIREITERAGNSPALHRAYEEARHLATNAAGLVKELPRGDCRDLLETLATLVVEREL